MPATKRNNPQLFVAPVTFFDVAKFEGDILAKKTFTFKKTLDLSVAGVFLGAPAAPRILNNYNVNTFTPKIQDASFSDAEGQTYNTQLGFFTEIGTWVFFDLKLDVLSSGSLSGSGPVNVILDGAPTMKSDGMGTVLVGDVTSFNLAASGRQVSGRMDPATDSIRLMELNLTAGHGSITVTRFQNGAFIMSGHYEKA